MTSNARVALVAHFERSPGPHVLPWIAPVIARLFRPAGISVEWFASRDTVPAHAARTLDVWFHGECRPIKARMNGSPPPEIARLGWVYSHNGRIAGDVIVDCTAIMGVAREARGAGTNLALCDVVFLRLLERVVIHELLHVLLMSAEHGNTDCTMPRIHASDWIRIGHLSHAEEQSLRELYGPATVSSWRLNR